MITFLKFLNVKSINKTDSDNNYISEYDRNFRIVMEVLIMGLLSLRINLKWS